MKTQHLKQFGTMSTIASDKSTYSHALFLKPGTIWTLSVRMLTASTCNLLRYYWKTLHCVLIIHDIIMFQMKFATISSAEHMKNFLVYKMTCIMVLKVNFGNRNIRLQVH